MTVHHLKTWPQFFERVASGEKTFEVRRAVDRLFQAGDTLVLQEWTPPGEIDVTQPGDRIREFQEDPNAYTGRELQVEVLFVMPGGQFGIEAGHVVMSLGPPEIAGAATARWERYANGKCRRCDVFRSVDVANVCRPCATGVAVEGEGSDV